MSKPLPLPQPAVEPALTPLWTLLVRVLADANRRRAARPPANPEPDREAKISR